MTGGRENRVVMDWNLWYAREFILFRNIYFLSLLTRPLDTGVSSSPGHTHWPDLGC